MFLYEAFREIFGLNWKRKKQQLKVSLESSAGSFVVETNDNLLFRNPASVQDTVIFMWRVLKYAAFPAVEEHWGPLTQVPLC